MSFKQLVKPQPPRLDGASRFGRFTVHPDAYGASCTDAQVRGDAGDSDETTVRLSDEQFPQITSVRPAHRPDLASRVFSFLRWQGPMMLTGMVLGFSFFTIARVPLGAASAPLAPTPRAAPPVAVGVAEPIPMRAMPSPPPPPIAAEPSAPLFEPERVAARAKSHRRHAKRADRAACDPPFRYDADGIKRMKLKCL
jgi:hypothetical protein